MEVDLYRKVQDPITFIERAGKFITESGMFGCTKSQQGMVLAWACMAEKKSPVEIKAKYHVFASGDLALRADWMLAEYRRRGGSHKIISRTQDRAEIEMIPTGGGDPQRFAFTWEEAQKEPFPWTYDKKTGKKILKTNWETPRARMQMLWARVTSDAVRAMAPEVNSGMYTPEEIEDTPVQTVGDLIQKMKASASQPEQPPIEAATSVVTNEPAAPQPATPAAPEAATGPDGLLNSESVAHLVAAFGGSEEVFDATQFLFDIGFLKAGETLKNLSVARANRILKNPDGFKQALNEARDKAKASSFEPVAEPQGGAQ